MKGSCRNTYEHVVFTKWTRKSFATFASLKKVVNIGHLAIEICDSSLKKVEVLIRAFESLCFKDELDEPKEEEIVFLDKFLAVLICPNLTKIESSENKILYCKFSKPIFCKSRIWALILYLRNGRKI